MSIADSHIAGLRVSQDTAFEKLAPLEEKHKRAEAAERAAYEQLQAARSDFQRLSNAIQVLEGKRVCTH